MIAGFPFLSSCNKDEKPKPAGITFEDDYEEVNESDGTWESFHPAVAQDGTGREIKVKLTLDKALAETAVISYSVAGTALPNSAANPVGDFEIENDNLIIEKGATETIISIQLFEDLSYEYTDYNNDGLPYENIILKLESVVSGPAVIGEKNTFQLDILEDDGIFFLVWDPQDDPGEDNGDVNMDLFVWLDNELWDGSAGTTSEQEYVVVAAGFPDGAYTFSYTYYAGTSNDLDFYAIMFGNLNNQAHPYPDEPLVYTGNYTLVNKNTYVKSEAVPPVPPDVKIVQSMTKSGLKFTNVSDISEPAAGSRIGARKPSIKITPELLKKWKLDPTKKEIRTKLNPAFRKK